MNSARSLFMAAAMCLQTHTHAHKHIKLAAQHLHFIIELFNRGYISPNDDWNMCAALRFVYPGKWVCVRVCRCRCAFCSGYISIEAHSKWAPFMLAFSFFCFSDIKQFILAISIRQIFKPPRLLHKRAPCHCICRVQCIYAVYITRYACGFQ